jgi:hypothetical protein
MPLIMSKKRMLLVAALMVVFIGLASWLLLTQDKPQPLSPPVTLPDGTSVRLLAVTYGTNHVFGTRAARMFARLPLAIQDFLSDLPGVSIAPAQMTTTPIPELLLWLDQRTNGVGSPPSSSAYLTAVLGDGSNFISGTEPGVASSTPMSLTYPLRFAAFPRRDRQITLNIFQHDSDGGARLCGSLSFINPHSQTYPQWQPETLPVTRRAGDLEVTLQRVESGTTDSGGKNETSVYLKFHPLTNDNEVWTAEGAEVSDATGNSVHSSGSTWSWGENPVLRFSPGLWPGEAAWKLKLEFKKTDGLRPEEIFAFKNVPLGVLDQTNAVGRTTNIAGVTVTLQSIYRRAPITNSSWTSLQFSMVHVSVSGMVAGTELDMLRMECDAGKTSHADSWSSGGDERDYGFREIPLAAQTADFTFAVQQSRTVEFIVKPELPKPKTGAGK